MAKNVVPAGLSDLLGKEVWFRNSYCDIQYGILERVLGTGHARINTKDVEGNVTGARCVAHANDIFLTKEDLMGANYERFQALMQSYEDEIKNVEDLVRFCYNHPVCKANGDYDSEARMVARMKAKELLGIEIDEDAAKLDSLIKDALAGEE